MRIIWETPPDIRQSSIDTCWAAVLETFCRVSPGRPNLDQQGVLKEFGYLANSPLDRKISLNGIRRLFADNRFGIEVEEVSPTYFSITPAFLFQKLIAGPAIVCYWEPATHGRHVSLIYGIDGTAVSYLNPDLSGGGFLKNDLRYFATKDNVLIGSRRWQAMR